MPKAKQRTPAKKQLDAALSATSSLTPLTYPSHAEIDAFLCRMMVKAGEQRTETIDPHFKGMDQWSNAKILDAFSEVQLRAVAAVYAAKPQIDKAAQAIIDRLQPDGRLIYVGAGTSGRLGAVDGMEIGPTFDFPDDRVVFATAEDPEFKTGTSREGREDHEWRAVEKIKALKLKKSDVVIAIAASGTTPYTRKFAQLARSAGALVIGIANNRDAPLLHDVECPILLETGAEAIRGSTRMGAGTAQKIALTELSSLVMAKLPGIFGVHDGIMSNMRDSPIVKLSRRAIQTVTDFTGCSKEEATQALLAYNRDMKFATLVIRGSTPEEAEELLQKTQRNLRAAMLLQERAKRGKDARGASR